MNFLENVSFMCFVFSVVMAVKTTLRLRSRLVALK